MNQSKLWTKDFIILSAASFFIALTFYLLMTSLTVYAIEQFNASTSMAGLASSIFIIGALVFRVFAGKYIEFIGRNKMYYGGLLLFMIASILYFIVDNMSMLLFVRFLHGAAFGLSATAMSVAVMDIIPNERRGEGTSYYSMSIVLATAVGPFLGLFISQHASFTMIFVVCLLFSVISIVISLFAHIPEAKLAKAQLDEMKGFQVTDFFEKRALPISAIIGIIAFCYSSILSFLSAYATEIELTEAASYFYIVYAVFILISRPFTGRLLDKRGDNVVIYPAILLLGIGFIIFSGAHHHFTILLAGALIALGFGTLQSCCQAIAVNEALPHRIGLAISTYFIFMDAGMGIGPFLLGFIIPVFGFRGMYTALALIVFVCIFLYYVLHGKKKSMNKEYSQAS
ncbi:MFS transporter [Metabacillus sediminilitoris]|uniref:MFS transporter n=1 Tax=Metabacillus sediminilitoris TaxID=2567941 RepID=A0A4V3WG38_9BACI|nr:MFS transporter [Metabacillus sediminilitoris]QGQ45274.1 MFS transporter [Metabacillus sediminilitoris]THF82427.1 MFS transporter [Metabacillus sediminilitoris]